jgi:hypothetical protein
MAKKAAGKRKKAAGKTKKRVGAKTATAASVRSAQALWTPGSFAAWSQRWDDPNDASPAAVLLHHPTAPFPDDPLIVDQIDDATVQQLAFDYLNQVNEQTDPPLDLPTRWLDQLDPASPPANPTFKWLPIGWPSDDPDFADPFVSFRVVRETGGEVEDDSVVLLASEWRKGAYLGSEFGLRVVVSVRPTSNDKFEVCITGLASARPRSGRRSRSSSAWTTIPFTFAASGSPKSLATQSLEPLAVYKSNGDARAKSRQRVAAPVQRIIR